MDMSVTLSRSSTFAVVFILSYGNEERKYSVRENVTYGYAFGQSQNSDL